MFTGIVEALGRVHEITLGAQSARLTVNCSAIAAQAVIGESVAVNGCCLTVVAILGDGLTFDAVPETLRMTNLGDLLPGDPVNIERPLSVNARLGGHFVQGHIDGIGTIRSITPEDNAMIYSIEVDPSLQKYLIAKGSIAVDGISLTVARMESFGFSVWIIPHTMEVTTLGSKQVGSKVNIECDVLGKYVERLLSFGTNQNVTASTILAQC